MNRLIICITISILALSSCKSQNLRTYYFDIADFNNKGKVYVFTDQNDTSQVQYWHMSTKITDGDTLFVTDGLDKRNRPVEVFVERIKDNNTEMVDYYFIRYDSSGNDVKIPSMILKKQVYSFDHFKDTLVWSVKYQNAYGEEQMDKSRSLIELNVSQRISGESYQCALFRDEFSIRAIDGNQTYKLYQESYYAKNVGLVRFVRTLPDGSIMDYQLTDIIEK
ncbi:MAG: hypothetical protein ACJA0Q_002050 [Saprospiraceae bacterium]|jgi:hypothetical protein